MGTSAQAFAKATAKRRVISADQQGKYFYVCFDQPPHAVMHFGMTGWMKFDCEDSAYYKQAKEVDRPKEPWPPKYAKFLWKCEAETIDGKDREAVEAAFVDARRLARIRLVDCEADKIRDASPLKENGPDPVRDREIVTVEWLSSLLGRKRVPVKALLLDQANLSGIGNWVADEVLYQARIHPEQYSNSLSEKQLGDLHEALHSVCTTAVDTLADSKQFPDTWLMKYRWNKGKAKDANVLPNGDKIVHLTVGGRTSAIVPARQKKTAAVAGDVDSSDAQGSKPAKVRKRKVADEDGVDQERESVPAKRAANGRPKANAKTNGEMASGAGEADVKVEEKPFKPRAKKSKNSEKQPTAGTRRSTRNRD